jgi:hypothetical protein
MPQPCEQHASIATLVVENRNISLTLNRMERGQERVVELLERSLYRTPVWTPLKPTPNAIMGKWRNCLTDCVKRK